MKIDKLVDKRLITQAEYARFKGISRSRVCQKVKKGQLPSVWVSGSKLVLLTPEELRKLESDKRIKAKE